MLIQFFILGVMATVAMGLIVWAIKKERDRLSLPYKKEIETGTNKLVYRSNTKKGLEEAIRTFKIIPENYESLVDVDEDEEAGGFGGQVEQSALNTDKLAKAGMAIMNYKEEIKQLKETIGKIQVILHDNIPISMRIESINRECDRVLIKQLKIDPVKAEELKEKFRERAQNCTKL